MSGQLDFTFNEDNFVPIEDGEPLAPIRAQATYYTEYGDDDLNGIPILFTLSAGNNVDIEIIQAYAEELRFSCGLFKPQEDYMAEREEVVHLLEETVDLLENTWSPEEFLAGVVTEKVRETLQWARFWAGEQVSEDGPEPSTEIDNVLFIDFGVHPDYREDVHTPVYLTFDLDPTISPGDPEHSYAVPSFGAVFEPKTSGGEIRAGFGEPTRRVGTFGASIKLLSHTGCFRVSGVTDNCQYRIWGAMHVDYSDLPGREC